MTAKTIKMIFLFKFFMVIFVWGLLPLLLPAPYFSFFDLHPTAQQLLFIRIWGVIVLLDTFLYLQIYRHPTSKLSKYLLLFAIADNAGFGLILLILTPIFHLPWGLWINIPFQLFFGYWFWRFYKEWQSTISA